MIFIEQRSILLKILANNDLLYLDIFSIFLYFSIIILIFLEF